GRTAAIDRPMRRLYHLAIGQARRTITITSAYFVPDRALRRALRRAVERGVRVRLLLPAVSDVAPVLYASQRHFDRLLRRGVEIYRYEPSILHAKTAVIDGEWSTIGSANMDSLSFNWNLEANFVVEDRETGRELEDRFEVDLRHSERVDLAEWRRRPWWHRVIEWGASILGPVL
ncbi:MAG: phospholipase D-like domain-containing protein, partial [Planctomycetota bacterium]